MMSMSRLVLLFLTAVSVTAFKYSPSPQPDGYPALPQQNCALPPQNLPDGGIFRPAESGKCKQSTIEVCASKKCTKIAANGGTEICLKHCDDPNTCLNQCLASWQNGCQPKAGGPSVDPWNIPYPGPFDKRQGACTTNEYVELCKVGCCWCFRGCADRVDRDFPCVLTRDNNYVP
ncbi:hypothetical protein IWX47DRAFT_384418 [Phyllosticta citricarpa]